MSDRRKKNAVYIVTVSESFRPQRPWDFPDLASAGELYARNITLCEAKDFCRVFNRRQMATGLVERKWALAITHTRFRWTEHTGPKQRPQSAQPEHTPAVSASVEITIGEGVNRKAGDEGREGV